MHPDPGQAATIPAVAQEGADYVLAVRQQVCDVVGLIQHAFAIIGEVRRQDTVPDALAVQENAVASESGHVESGALYIL